MISNRFNRSIMDTSGTLAPAMGYLFFISILILVINSCNQEPKNLSIQSKNNDIQNAFIDQRDARISKFKEHIDSYGIENLPLQDAKYINSLYSLSFRLDQSIKKNESTINIESEFIQLDSMMEGFSSRLLTDLGYKTTIDLSQCNISLAFEIEEILIYRYLYVYDGTKNYLGHGVPEMILFTRNDSTFLLPYFRPYYQDFTVFPIDDSTSSLQKIGNNLFYSSSETSNHYALYRNGMGYYDTIFLHSN